MRVYFYVYKMEKEKCEFVFTYLKNDEQNICGRATVELTTCPMKVDFDSESEGILSEKEKRGIISEVLINLKL